MALLVPVFFIVRLLDPVTAVLAILAGMFCRAWWHVAIAAVVVSGAVELVLASTQAARAFSPLSFVMGAIAAAVWCSAAMLVRGFMAHRLAEP